ncbi:MAG: hypothetical protein GX020_06685 [Firmicutes bacterium]|nr:hypothetical protein [Bacillota bacterium]
MIHSHEYGTEHFKSDYMILEFHGDEDNIWRFELGEKSYEENELRGNFGIDEVEKYSKLKDALVINAG